MGSAPNGWQNPRQNWSSADVVGASDFQRIEGNINAIESGSRTIDPTQAPTGNVGSLRQMLDWFANRIKAITGASNWYDNPVKSLAQLQSEKVGRGSANTDVEQVKAVLLRTDTRTVVLTYDGNGRLMKAEEMDGETVAKTTNMIYDASGRLSQVQETAGGVTVTSTLNYGPDGKLANVAKAVG